MAFLDLHEGVLSEFAAHAGRAEVDFADGWSFEGRETWLHLSLTRRGTPEHRRLAAESLSEAYSRSTLEERRARTAAACEAAAKWREENASKAASNLTKARERSKAAARRADAKKAAKRREERRARGLLKPGRKPGCTPHPNSLANLELGDGRVRKT